MGHVCERETFNTLLEMRGVRRHNYRGSDGCGAFNTLLEMPPPASATSRCAGRTFNTLLEMHTSDMAAKILSHLSFQYSIRDALYSAYPQYFSATCAFNTLLEMPTPTLSTAKMSGNVLLTFNTLLEMLSWFTRAVSMCSSSFNTLLEMPGIHRPMESQTQEITFNTLLEMPTLCTQRLTEAVLPSFNTLLEMRLTPRRAYPWR